MPREKIWKATVSRFQDEGEFLLVLAAAARCHGTVCSTNYLIPEVGELTAQFKNEDDVAAFDVAVCDFGFDIAWEV